MQGNRHEELWFAPSCLARPDTGSPDQPGGNGCFDAGSRYYQVGVRWRFGFNSPARCSASGTRCGSARTHLLAPARPAPLQATSNGLNNLLIKFIDSGFELATENPAIVSLDNPGFQLMWNVGNDGQVLDVRVPSRGGGCPLCARHALGGNLRACMHVSMH